MQDAGPAGELAVSLAMFAAPASWRQTMTLILS